MGYMYNRYGHLQGCECERCIHLLTEMGIEPLSGRRAVSIGSRAARLCRRRTIDERLRRLEDAVFSRPRHRHVTSLGGEHS
jgi:hypothetical protein